MRSQEETVLEMLRRGPITQTMLPDVGNLRAVICRLQKYGHNIKSDRRGYYDGTRMRRNAEYRLLPPKKSV